MAAKKKNLAVRVISALLLLPIVLVALWWGGLPLTVLVSLASALVALELYGMVGVRPTHPAAVVGWLSAASFAWFAGDLGARWPWLVGVVALAPIATFSLSTLRPPGRDLARAAQGAAWIATSIPYAGLLAAVVGLRSLPEGIVWTLLALAMTWGNDTGAYFAGLGFGKNKLYPLVSPNKTWEGFAGGMIVSILMVWIVRLFEPSLTWIDVIVLGGGAGILGPLGDLSESMIKRAYGVKDSGRLIPGHGGIFDRIDALLFIAPWTWAYLSFLRG